MPKVRIVVEFSVPKGESYRRSRHYLSEALIKAGWSDKQFTLMNIGNIIGQTVTRERARVSRETMVPFGGTISQEQANVATANYRKRFPGVAAAYHHVRAEDVLRQSTATMEFKGADLERLAALTRPRYEPEATSWWDRLLVRLRLRRQTYRGSLLGTLGTFSGLELPDSEVPADHPWKDTDRYRK